jgi:hypothetical protein
VWPGLIWLVGVGIYLLAVPLILSIRSRQADPVDPGPGRLDPA